MHEADIYKRPQVQFFSVNEAALVLGVDREQIRIWVQDGLLKAYQLGSQRHLARIRRVDLDAFIQKHGNLVDTIWKSSEGMIG